ncbi:MAG: DinB family protein [Bacteroidota bacterium]
MKTLLTLLFVPVSLLVYPPLFAQDEVFVKEYLERLENSQKHLLLVAEMMPEEQYDFKPTPESLSFAEQLMHIGWAMDWHSQSLMGGRKARNWETDTELKVDQKNKKEMMETLDKTFNTTIAFIKDFDLTQLNETLDYFGLTRTKRQILLLLTDHITHHRSQMLVYMRLKGIKPPRYVLYQ